MKIENILGAVIAALIAFITGALALLTQDGVATLGDIGQVAWIVLAGGALVTFLKDFEAIDARRALATVTGSGNVHSPAAVGILAGVLAVLMLSGCAGTTAAYRAADGLEETAYVMNQHFLGLVREGNELRRTGALAGSALTTAQNLVETGRPILRTLSEAAQAYKAVKSAANQDELTVAIANAAVQLSALLNYIREAGGSAQLLDQIELDLALAKAA